MVGPLLATLVKTPNYGIGGGWLSRGGERDRVKNLPLPPFPFRGKEKKLIQILNRSDLKRDLKNFLHEGNTPGITSFASNLVLWRVVYSRHTMSIRLFSRFYFFK